MKFVDIEEVGRKCQLNLMNDHFTSTFAPFYRRNLLKEGFQEN